MADKTVKIFRINGCVIDDKTREGLAGLRVEAWDKDLIFNDLVAGTVTDAVGAFQIKIDASYFAELFLDRRPDLFFKVFRDETLLKSTEDYVLWNAEAGKTKIEIEVDPVATTQPVLPPAEPEVTVDSPPALPTVRGYVLREGKSSVGILVRAYYKYLRSKDPLGERVTTDQEGQYKIVYTAEQYARAQKGSAILHVFVVSDKGDELAFSELSDAPSEAVLDLILPVEPEQRSRFEILASAILPLLKNQGGQDLQVAELEEDEQHRDLSFLSVNAGLEKKDVARFVIAHRLAQPSLQPEFWFALLHGSFFQFIEDQSLAVQSTVLLDSLHSIDAAAVRKRLAQAFNENETPEAFREKVPGWIEAFLGYFASRSVRGEGRPTFVKSALEDAGITTAQKQEKFARLLNEHKAMTPELMDVLDKDRSFKKTEIADLRTSYRLADITRGDFSVIRMLKQDFGVRQPENIRSLARKSESEWVNLIKEKHATGEIELPLEIGKNAGQTEYPAAEVYGKKLERQFREAFPTTAFAGGLERALQNGGAHGLRRAQDLGNFLEEHEEFELLNTSVDDFLKNNIRPDFKRLAGDENFSLEVKAVQRVFKLAPTFEATDALLADDLHSAQKIYRMGESEFVRRYADSPGFTEESARLAWNRAADTYGAVLTIVADLKALDAEGLAVQLKNNHKTLSTFPNWDNLFKTGDLCECEQCRSVLGPAAYFADLLMFLKDRKAVTGHTVKDILFHRRPDLGFLELACDNGLTAFPYIDVVCEVLEDAVDAKHENDLDLVMTSIAPATGVDLETAFKQIFKDAFTDRLNDGKEKIELGDNISLSWVKPAGPNPGPAVVHSDNVTYLLERSVPLLPQAYDVTFLNPVDAGGTSAVSAEILRNTKASAAELRAYPYYVNPKAYEKLRAAKYPRALPFDLFAEEVRAAFQKTNLQRWDLMRTLRGPAAPNNPNDGDIAAEYFGISSSADPADPSEKKLILEAAGPGQAGLWGEAAIPGNLKNVKVFLQKTGLEYNELLALLDLSFTNPRRDIKIDDLDPSCDIDRKIIQGLDDPTTGPAKLDRIHRFLRLWRKLTGWKMWELDLAIYRIGKGKLDEPFLINLFYFSEVRKKLGGKTSVEQVCSLFGNLNARTRFTKLHEKREDALYQNVFLNKRLIHPLDPAFQIRPNTGDLFEIDPNTGNRTPPLETIGAHLAVIQAALGISETDLLTLRSLTKASDGSPYISDDMNDPLDPNHVKNGLNLANLSFLWRHAWLAKILKFKAEEWKTLLKLVSQDVPAFPDPKAAWEFLQTVTQLKETGFTPDELNWLLAADRSAKAAPKEADAIRFFAGLRKELQGIRAEYDLAKYDFLTTPLNEQPLIELLTTLLQKLNRDEAEVTAFLKTLRGSVLLEASAVLAGFTFPTTITSAAPAGAGIPIQYNAGVFRFTGLMTDAQRTTLLDDSQPALLALRQSALLEADVPGGLAGFTFPTTITGGTDPISIQYVAAGGVDGVLRLVGLMTDAQREALLDENDASLAAVVGIPAYRRAIEQLYQDSLTLLGNYRSAIEELYQQSLKAVADYFSMDKDIALPAAFAFPSAVTGTPNAAAIRYDGILRFTGLMTAGQRTALTTPSLVTLAGTAASAYQAAIEEFFNQPRLAVKFFEPAFTASLAKLPAVVDFKAQLPDRLAPKITFDAEARLLRFSGIMTDTEKAALLNLSGDAAFAAAVNSLADQPQAIGPTDARVWLTEDDLDPTQPATDTYAKRLANAARKALKYLSATSVDNAVVQQSSAVFGITEALTRRLFTSYAPVPILPAPTPPSPTKTTLMAHLTGNFSIDSTTFNGWFWANRVAAIFKKWKITPADLDKLITLTKRAKLLDFSTLPLDTSGSIASLEEFVRTSRLLKIRDTLPEADITLLEVLEKLNSGAYSATSVNVQDLPAGFRDFPAAITTGPSPIPIQHNAGVFRFTGQMSISQRSTLLTDASLATVTGVASYRLAIEALFRSNFAGDVERLNEAWLATDVVELVASLDLVYPADYLLAESWERMRRVFYFLDNLNAGAKTVKTFAAPAMTDVHARTIKELLRSKFGVETWLAVSAEIQDILRERKRDALAAYLLSRPMPADAPSGKWENNNDLYAYYLLDVEMASCQLTSRLVQASGSVQLFVQRCFMGLEPGVVVQADGADGYSAWRWWKWMRKFQVWVANRKVFLWPENWIEPELKKDRSTFFKDMENELLQNEVNQFTVETAFSNYLEKLNGVAQLEIAGFFQEDDGNNAIVHVFGRTVGAEPHLYYYRRYDYRQWTPWERVELDIQGDYLIPAVLNKRLFLFWPVFTEVPDETGNNTMKVPTPGQKIFARDPARKKLKLQMAMSDYRQGRWAPKKVSKDFDESKSYAIENLRKTYQFSLIDRGNGDGRVVIQYDSHSVDMAAIEAALAAALAVAKSNKKIADEDVASATKTSADAADDAVSAREATKKVAELVTQAENLAAFMDNDSDPIGHRGIDKENYAKAVVAAIDVIDGFAPNNLAASFQDDAGFVGDLAEFKKYVGWTRDQSIEANKSNNPNAAKAAGWAKERAHTARDAANTLLKTAQAVRDDIASQARTAARDLRTAKIKAQAAQAAVGALSSRAQHPNSNDFIAAALADATNASLSGAFDISGSTGAPEKTNPLGTFTPAIQPEQASVGDVTAFLKWVELPSHDSSRNDFTLVNSLTYRPAIPDTLVLGLTPDIFKMSPAWHLSYVDQMGLASDPSHAKIGTWLPFFYKDKKRSFLALPSSPLNFTGSPGDRGYYLKIKNYLRETFFIDVGGYPEQLTSSEMVQYLSYLVSLSEALMKYQQFDFKNFYHPFVRDFAELVYNPLRGIPSLMSRETQLKNSGFSFEASYQPAAVVKLPPQYPLLNDRYPIEVVDFTPDGAYSSYNWELFFHAPLLIANTLSKDQRFEEAREWYHFIFNPIGMESAPGGSVISKYWITKPFFETTDPEYIQQRIDNIMGMLAKDKSGPTGPLTELEKQVLDWRTNPFEPHRIANYRTVAYQKTVVMKYIDNLVAWGDYLFRQDSMESINEATQLYVLAAEILGPRPKIIPPRVKPPVASFNELETEFDKFSNALVQVENLVPLLTGKKVGGADQAPLPMLYFCIPQNDKMLGYWDTVADRLFKIRHCMNIEGVVRQLALFEPPIDPAALVKAVAGGADISAALGDLNTPLPLYRFNVLCQKANEICNDVKALGGALLAALEKKDAEALGLLRQSQEIRLLEAVKTVREKQIEEAKENLLGAQKSKELAEIKKKYYESREFMNAGEIVATVLNSASIASHTAGTIADILAGVMFLIPDFKMGASGFGGTPHMTVEPPTGEKVGQSTARGANGLYNVATILDKSAALASTLSSYQRRQEEWHFQVDMAVKEAEQIDRSIATAELRIAIAEKELEDHVIQIENAKATDEFMRSKYTNEELFQWQVGQIQGVYFQSYKLAYDLAKRAERCFRFELGVQDSSYINFGYWDSLKKGLMSGEKLQYDLRRLEAAYLEQNRREFELTKHISLALLDPLALVKLRETGRCFLRLPEEIFDLDYPGHYFRRIKSVSLTLPCVVGPYTTISCTLRLLKNSVRINTAKGNNGYSRNTDEQGLPAGDGRFIENNIPAKAIAASSAQNDSGVFELSFRDERYLPFEGAGAVSEWSLELFNDATADFGKALRQFDYSTVSDAILHIKYTAREDAGVFKNGAIAHLREYFSQDDETPSLRMFNLRQEFPTQWHRFLNPTNAANGNVLELEMSPELFPWRDADKTLKINTIWLLARCTDPGSYTVQMAPPFPSASLTADPNKLSLVRVNQYGGLHFGQKDVAQVQPPIELSAAEPPVKWKLSMTGPGTNLGVEDLILVLGYQWE